MTDDPFEILGVSRNATEPVIKAAYKARIREVHPDAGGDAALASKVNDAYALLMNPTRRAEWLREHAPRVQEQPQTPRQQPQERAPYTEPAYAREQAQRAAQQRWESVPEPTYETFDSPGAWWASLTAIIPLVVFLAAAYLTGGVVPLVVAVVASVIAMRRSVWAAIIGLAGSAAALTEYADPTAVFHEYAWAPAAAYSFMVICWLVARRAARNRLYAHIGDVFYTTMGRFRLIPYRAQAVTHDGGRDLIHLERADGQAEWPLPTAMWDGRVTAGDYVLVYKGRVVYSATTDELRYYEKAGGDALG